jgi:hypothetical protein
MRKAFPKVVYMDNYTKVLWVSILLFVIFTYTVGPVFKLLGQYERINEKLWKKNLEIFISRLTTWRTKQRF